MGFSSRRVSPDLDGLILKGVLYIVLIHKGFKLYALGKVFFDFNALLVHFFYLIHVFLR